MCGYSGKKIMTSLAVLLVLVGLTVVLVNARPTHPPPSYDQVLKEKAKSQKQMQKNKEKAEKKLQQERNKNLKKKEKENKKKEKAFKHFEGADLMMD